MWWFINADYYWQDWRYLLTTGLAESITFTQNMQHALECVVCEGSHCCQMLWTSNRMQELHEEVARSPCHLSPLLLHYWGEFPTQEFDDISCLQFAMDEKYPIPQWVAMYNNTLCTWHDMMDVSTMQYSNIPHRDRVPLSGFSITSAVVLSLKVLMVPMY